MVYEQTRLSRPLSRIELGVSILLISLFIGIFIHRVLVLTAAAEATALELTLRNMRTGVRLKVANLLIEGDYAGIVALANSNPMSVLDTPTEIYKGTVNNSDDKKIDRGKWYFDENSKQLLYGVVNSDYFVSKGNIAGRIRIRFKLNYEDRNKNGSFDEGVDLPRGISVIVMDPYRWTF